jgi:hypothetical protein
MQIQINVASKKILKPFWKILAIRAKGEPPWEAYYLMGWLPRGIQ